MKTLYTTSMALLLVAGLSACEQATTTTVQPLQKVTITELGTAAATEYREFLGQVVPAELTPLSFRQAGEISQLSVKSGQNVSKGQLLAKLDERKIKQQYDDAQSRLELAERQYQRAKNLVSQKLISQAEQDELKANLDISRTNFRQAQAQLDYTELRAPFDGMVGDVNKEAFETASVGETVLEIYQDQKLYVQIAIPDQFMARLDRRRADHSYVPEVYFGEDQQTYPIHYLEHTSEPDPQTRAYLAWFQREQLPNTVLPGSSATMRIDLAKSGIANTKGFRLPITAIDAGLNRQEFFVWKVIDQQAKRASVLVSEVSPEGVLVISGLDTGDQIITSNVSKLREGMLVEVINGDAAQ